MSTQLSKKIAQELSKRKSQDFTKVDLEALARDFNQLMQGVSVPPGVSYGGLRRDSGGGIFAYVNQSRELRHPEEYGGTFANPRLEARLSAAQAFDAKLFQAIKVISKKYGVQIEVHA